MGAGFDSGPRTMTTKLVCWRCGGSLKDMPRPIRRSNRCPHCRSDVHVCRMCNHYTPRYIGECDHDKAERVVDKTAANFCSYFRPRPDAHKPPAMPEIEKASEALGELFGIEGGAGAVTENPVSGPRLETADTARRELESLFGLDAGEEDATQGDDEPPAKGKKRGGKPGG